MEPADRGIGRGHRDNDALDSLYGEDYGLTDPTTPNVSTASAPPSTEVPMVFCCAC
jgi:hypothetical protein